MALLAVSAGLHRTHLVEQQRIPQPRAAAKIDACCAVAFTTRWIAAYRKYYEARSGFRAGA